MKVETQKAWKEREAGEMANVITDHMISRAFIRNSLEITSQGASEEGKRNDKTGH